MRPAIPFEAAKAATPTDNLWTTDGLTLNSRQSDGASESELTSAVADDSIDTAHLPENVTRSSEITYRAEGALGMRPQHTAEGAIGGDVCYSKMPDLTLADDSDDATNNDPHAKCTLTGISPPRRVFCSDVSAAAWNDRPSSRGTIAFVTSEARGRELGIRTFGRVFRTDRRGPIAGDQRPRSGLRELKRLDACGSSIAFVLPLHVTCAQITGILIKSRRFNNEQSRPQRMSLSGVDGVARGLERH